MADEPVARGEGFIIIRRVEQGRGKIGAERSADLNRLDRTARECATAYFVDEFTERDAKSRLEQTTVLDIAGELDRQGSPRAAQAEVAVERARTAAGRTNCAR